MEQNNKTEMEDMFSHFIEKSPFSISDDNDLDLIHQILIELCRAIISSKDLIFEDGEEVIFIYINLF